MTKIPWYRTSFGDSEIQAVRDSIENEHISQGSVTGLLEEKLAKSLNVPYAVVTTSGSVALLLSCMACGIKSGDEVIVPNRTWIATAHAPMILGAKTTLVDVLKDKPLIDASQIEKEITDRTKAIIPVHLNGRSVDITAVNSIAKKYNLQVIEDACQALFSKNSDGYLGTQSDLGCFSLGTTKLIATGQGGVVVTKNKDMYEKLKLLRNHGTTTNIDPIYYMPSLNFKFTDILASIGIVQLSKAEERIKHVRDIYEIYCSEISGLEFIKNLPVDIGKGEVPLYMEVLCRDRKKLVDYLNSKDIETRPFLPNINFAEYIKTGGNFPNSDYFAEHGLFLPCGPTQPMENILRVAEEIKRFGK